MVKLLDIDDDDDQELFDEHSNEPITKELIALRNDEINGIKVIHQRMNRFGRRLLAFRLKPSPVRYRKMFRRTKVVVIRAINILIDNAKNIFSITENIKMSNVIINILFANVRMLFHVT